MGRGKKKKVPIKSQILNSTNDSFAIQTRRSSMRVNLSYVSNISDSENLSLKRISSNTTNQSEESLQHDDSKRDKKQCKKKNLNLKDNTVTPVSVKNVTIITAGPNTPNHCNSGKSSKDIQSTSLSVIKEKEQQLSKSCMQLKDEIMNKTQALFDKENELAIKTSEVLAAGCTSPSNNRNELSNKRSPSIRIAIGKNDQIIMSGDGRKRNPVQVNAMLRHHSPGKESNTTTQQNCEDLIDCNQSIVSTPKKLRIENSLEKRKSSRTPETILRIPVARLFTDDNDPNNSMSEINPLVENNSNKINVNDNNTNKSIVNNATNIDELNSSTSPILSQGTRSRLSRLSLKKKLTKSLTQNSRLSSSIKNESFLGKAPLTCSSFIEKWDKTNNESKLSKDCTTNLMNKNSNTINNCKTIQLDDNENNSKTIDIGNSTEESVMQMTVISSHMPIIRRTFQHIIRKSLHIDNLSITPKGIQSISTQTQASSNQNTESNNKVDDSEQNKQTLGNNPFDEDCSINTERTSLDVNTSIDQIHSIDTNIQKENKKPSAVIETNKNSINRIEEDDTIVIQSHSICTTRMSMQVNTSLNSVRNSSGVITIHHEQAKNDSELPLQQNTSANKEREHSDKIASRQSSTSTIRSSMQVNTSLDSVQKSPITLQQNTSVNKEKEHNDKIDKIDQIASRQPSTSTVRSSMQVNTSLDSARKSPITKNVLDFNKILSMVPESSIDDQNIKSVYTTNDQESDSDLENVSLIERIRNISEINKIKNFNEPNQLKPSVKRKSGEIEGNCSSNNTKKSTRSTSTGTKRKSSNAKDSNSSTAKKSDQTINLNKTRKSNGIENGSSTRSRKSTEIENISSTTNESSIIEATPYPTSRSVLVKTMIRNNIAMNTFDARKFVDFSDEEDTHSDIQTIIHKKTLQTPQSPDKNPDVYTREKTSLDLSDTVVLNTSDDSSDESKKEKNVVLIDESANDTTECNKSKNSKKSDAEQKIKKLIAKRKLYPLRENSQLISFSPAESFEDTRNEVQEKNVKKKKKLKITQKKKQEDKILINHPEPVNESKPSEDEILPEKVQKTKKKPRKIVSKKIVVKKVTNMTVLDNMMQDQEVTQRLSNRNSLNEFDLRRMRSRKKENARKHNKIIIVVTGLPKEDRDMLKSVIKTLGSATLEVNVTPRTTHVVSSGTRTINLLKGILRGCWLLSLEWALKSLDTGKWLDPSPYEMCHFAKAVQENRRDRQLFGKAYVPGLFITCGLIYIENGTSPPTSSLKELVKTAGGRITEDHSQAKIIVGLTGVKEIWILDSITTGETQPVDQYKRT